MHPCLKDDGTYEHLVPEGEEACARCSADSSARTKLDEIVAAKAAAPPAEEPEQPADLTPESEGERIPIEPVQLAILQRLDLVISLERITHLVLGALMAAIHGDTPRLPPEVWKAIGCTPKEQSGIEVPNLTL